MPVSDQAGAHLRSRMEEYFVRGAAAKEALVEKVAGTVIRDRLVPPTAMTFYGEDGGLVLRYSNLHSFTKIHRHALGQLSSKVGIPLKYVDMLGVPPVWRQTLLAHNFNELFHRGVFLDPKGEPLKFLHRIVGDELRGFLSRRYQRNLASLPMLHAFVEVCQAMEAQPVAAVSTAVKFGLKCYLPMTFQVFPGEFVAVGVEWANSDFGAGKMEVNSTLWRLRGNTFSTLDETISKVHLGAVIQESDIELSAETMAKEVDTVCSAIQDAVRAQLSPDTIDKLLSAIRKAAAEDISWAKLRQRLKKFLYTSELDNLEKLFDDEGVLMEIEDLPPPGRTEAGQPLPTRWWAVNAVSRLAKNAATDERRFDLEHAAGELLTS